MDIYWIMLNFLTIQSKIFGYLACTQIWSVDFCNQSLKWLLHTSTQPGTWFLITSKRSLNPSFCLTSFPWTILLKNIHFLQAKSEFFKKFEITKFWDFFIKLTPPPLQFYFYANSSLNYENQAIFGLFILFFTFT